METVFTIGDIVVSLSGHDKNRLFIVIGIDKNNKIVIIDGKYRGKSNPKAKNPKHLKVVAHDEKILNRLNEATSTDTEIYNMIKVYKQ